MTIPNVFTIPASAPFAETLAEGLIARYGSTSLSLADITVFLPTRRATRTFGDAFARVLGGAALLPQFRPLGDVDEDDSLFDSSPGATEIPPAIAPLRRRLLLATLVRRWQAAKHSKDLPFTQALSHADGLADLLDEIERQGADLDQLDELVIGSLAKHWEEVRDFLLILRDAWPEVLRAENALSPAAHRNAALAALAERLKRAASGPVIAAGSTGSIPATASLLATIAGLPNGAVVLPGLDRSVDADGWNGIDGDPAHPQFGLRQLLDRLGVAREDVMEWRTGAIRNDTREVLISQAMRPAPTTDAWRKIADGDTAQFARGAEGLSLIEAADPAEEAATIALALRQSLENADETAALVTPDRALARRVTMELTRFGIDVDDSGGTPLSRTPAGTFLCLVGEAAAAKFAPIQMFSLLKHPLCSFGQERADFLRGVRALELALRGPRPDPSLAGIARAISHRPRLSSLVAAIADVLGPLEGLMERDNVPLVDLIDAHTDAAERLSSGPDKRPRVWQKESGTAAAELMAALRTAAEDISPIEAASYAPIFRLIADEKAVRPAFGRHPRVAILGPLEARLQSFDTVVLGGLNEGTWPRAAPQDPWLSRPMRAQMGLEAPERAVGLSAHDFASLAARPRVIITRATKAEGAQTVPSRWLQRLQQFASGLGLGDAFRPELDWTGIARTINAPGPAARAKRPAPAPSVALRPRELSVTEMETWRRDPYAIYARHILRLRPLDQLDATVGPLERGTIVHKALEIFVTKFPGELPVDAAGQLIAIADALFQEEKIPAAVLAIWRPRFAHAAQWFVGQERERRSAIARSYVETEGTLVVPGPCGDFTLHGRADRIDILKGGGAAILDYKTGSTPTDKQVKTLLSPQLPLEGAIAASGGFPSVGAIEPRELVYVRFVGGAEPGSWRVVNINAREMSEKARAWLTERVARYDQETTPYLTRAIAYRTDIVGDYDHLARVGEWVVERLDDWDP
jgi:ATP-dependent helicase/nuclease subunit B